MGASMNECDPRPVGHPGDAQAVAAVRRALLVAVDPATQRLCRGTLAGAGVAVDVVDTGVAAVIAARQTHHDLIVVDDQLRDVLGAEAVGWLRSNPALGGTPIIVLTARAGGEAECAASRPGVWLRKPLSPDLVRRTILDALS